MRSISTKLLIGTIWCLVLLDTGHAQLFECRDAEGRKVFANSCPPGSTKTREIPAPINGSPSNANGGTTNNLNTKPSVAKPARTDHSAAQQSKEFAEWKRQQVEAEAVARDQQRVDDNKCYVDLRRLRELMNGQPLQTGTETNGDPIFMDDEKRLEEIKMIAERSKNCKQNDEVLS